MLKGRLGRISIDLWLCALILGGFSQASNIPMLQYLPCGSTATFLVRAPIDSLQKECHGNSDLCGIKIDPWSPALFKKYKVQNEREWL